MLNQLLVGRYLVTDVLGEGGLAKTYIARDRFQPSQPQCVVKILKPASKDSSFLHIARRLFNTEAKIQEKLGKHSQIPQLLAYFEENKEFFMIQEYIEGHTLDTELPPGHHWTESKTILMLQDVLSTLEFVHDSQVIHRDLKPNNLIRRNADGRIVLIDFGAVKQVRDARITTQMPLTPKTISIGTQGYMPVEQARGKPQLNSDLYSLGMIAIQALTGIDPYNLDENYNGEIIWRQYAQVSDKLAGILNHMVRYDFRHRYQTVKEVQQAIARLRPPVNVSTFDVNNQSPPRETKVSLRNKPSGVEVVAPDESKSKQIEAEIIAEVSPIETQKPKETRVSLNQENNVNLSPITTVSEPEKIDKSSARDAWTAWNNDSEILETPQKKSVEIIQIENQKLETTETATNDLEQQNSCELSNLDHVDSEILETPQKNPAEIIQIENQKLETKKTATNDLEQQNSCELPNLDHVDSEILETPQKNPAEIIQIENQKLETKKTATNDLEQQNSCELPNLDTVAKSPPNNIGNPIVTNDLNSEALTQLTPKKPSENITSTKASVATPPENKETRVSLKSESVKPPLNYQIKNTQTSLKKEEDNNKPSADVINKETKISSNKQQLENNQKNTKSALSVPNQTKASVNQDTCQKPFNNDSSVISQSNISSSTKTPSSSVNPSLRDEMAIVLSSSALVPSKPKPSSVKDKKYPLLIFSGIIITLFAAYFGYENFKQRQQYSQAEVAFQEIESLKNNKKYQECIQQAQAFSNEVNNFNLYLKSLLKDCSQGQLNAAKKLAQASSYRDAIMMVTAIPQGQEVYPESQQLISQWSQQIVKIATNKYHEGKLEQAIAILKAIPDNSLVTDQRETKIQEWQTSWKQNQSHIQKAEKAIAEKRWQDAKNEADQVTGNRHWINKSEAIINQANEAIAAQNIPKPVPRTVPRTVPRQVPKPVYSPPPTTSSSENNQGSCLDYPTIEERLRCFDRFWENIKK